MAVFGKPVRIHCTCYELGHCWTPSCVQASKDVAKDVFTEALKIYGALYLVTALVRRKGWKYYVKKFVPETLQSTIFLTVNGTTFISLFCVWRRVLGCYSFLSTCFLPAYLAAATALLFERRNRRGPLAIYLTNLAVETAFRMAVNRGLVRPVKNGEVLLFSVVSAVYLYLFRKKDGLPKSTVSVFRFLVGADENPDSAAQNANTNNSTAVLPSSAQPTSSTAAAVSPSQRPSEVTDSDTSTPSGGSTGSGTRQPLLETLMRMPGASQVVQALRPYWNRASCRLKASPRHGSCPHAHGCLHYVLKGLCRMFGVGYVVQLVIRLLSSLSAIRRSPRELPKVLWGPGAFGLAAFLGLYSAVFRGVNCALRWLREKDDAVHGMAAGFVAGGAMYFYKSVPVALFCASKLVEVLYFKGIDAGRLPYIPHAEVFIYAFTCAFVFHAAVMEPQALRPAYWKWLLRVTHNKFAVMNRRLLDVFGTNASQINPDFWPDYDPRYTDLRPPTS
ncbi:transmembrane protein 135-like isoform X2 [Babylonia areolata]|uniref:transmembrane protein 135-like isoform X2 n=1 Tax=Babylonia areolata TaxID=304850 RepID=UPI003FD2D7A0